MMTAAIETVDKCILCVDSHVVVDARFERLLGLAHPYGVKHCSSCGLRWLSPRPSAEGYAELYQFSNYFEGDAANECYSALADERRHYFRTRLDSIERSFVESSSLKIFEIGAATGEFIHEARRRGHRAEGVELSEGARKKALECYKIDLLPVMGTEKNKLNYDVVHMNHVLEHMPDPVLTITECANLLREGGLLVVEVPQQFDNDLDRLKRLLSKYRKVQFDNYSLHHTYFFTPVTLCHLLEKSGFSITRMVTANKNRTPLWPFKLTNLLLRIYLWVADRLHKRGNIIEVYAVRHSSAG